MRFPSPAAVLLTAGDALSAAMANWMQRRGVALLGREGWQYATAGDPEDGDDADDGDDLDDGDGEGDEIADDWLYVNAVHIGHLARVTAEHMAACAERQGALARERALVAEHARPSALPPLPPVK